MNRGRLYQQIAKRVRARRKELKMSQRALALHIEVTQPTISNIESARNPIPLHVIYDLAKALRLPRDLLLP